MVSSTALQWWPSADWRFLLPADVGRRVGFGRPVRQTERRVLEETGATVTDEVTDARGLDVLVLDCLRFREHPTHLWVDKALKYVERLRPRRTFFTHIAHDIKHARDSARLPAGVEFAYDGLVVE